MSSDWKLNVVPRRWQTLALEKWKQSLSGVVSVVTGGGKTIFAFLCIIEFRSRFPNGNVIIVVPTTALLDQWYISLREDLNLSDDEIALYSGEEKAKEPRLINLMVINTARETASSISAGRETFLIVDECHRAGSPVNSKALHGQHIATLGLSATPEREYDEGFSQFIGPVLGDIIYEYDYNEAYSDNVITSFELINVKIDLLEDEQKKYDELTRRAAIELEKLNAGTGSNDIMKLILQKRSAITAAATMRIPVSINLLEKHKGVRSIIFHERVSAANTILRNLRERNHRATVYHSNIGPDIRRDNLRLYRSGIFDVLVSCRALDEGMNVPETQVAVIASATASTRQRIQRLGRVLRPANNKESATVYTIYATNQEENRLRDEAVALKEITSVIWYKSERE